VGLDRALTKDFLKSCGGGNGDKGGPVGGGFYDASIKMEAKRKGTAM